MLRAMKHRNYRLFVEGQSLSLIGTWVQRIAVNWLTYSMTDSMFWLGAVNFAGSIPFFIFAPFGGIMADRWSKHKILLITQNMALLQSLVFCALYFLGDIKIWEILILNLILGIIGAVDMPVRQSFILEMVDNRKEDIQNAIAFNSTMVNTARLVGPGIAGVLIAVLGEGWCFLLNTLSFVAVVISLIRMRVSYAADAKGKRNIFQQFMEGAKYSFTTVPIKYFLFLLIATGLAGSALPTLAPAFARLCLNGSSETYGFLISAWGVGALFSAVYLMSRKSIEGLELIIAVSVVVFGLSVIAFSMSEYFYLAAIFMALAGVCILLEKASANTLLQTVSEPGMCGRVMSFYGMSHKGMSPFGSMAAGFLGEFIGLKYTLMLCGIICVAAAMIYACRLHLIRPHIKSK